MRLVCCLVLAAVAGGGAAASAQVPIAGRRAIVGLLERQARLTVEKASLIEALHQLRDRAGVPVAFSEDFLPADQRVSCDCQDVSVGRALRMLLASTGLSFAEYGRQIVIEPAWEIDPLSATGKSLEPRLAASPTEAVQGIGYLSVAPAGGQPRTINGVVVDERDRSVVGATVSVMGTETRSVTDGAGRFRLELPASNDVTLRVTAIGYRPLNQTVRPNDATVRLVIATVAVNLDEVVVTGTAGSQIRRAQGATVATIEVADVTQSAPVSSLTEILQSRIAGLAVTQSSGTTGTTQQIRVRGVSSISLSNEPLVFIDGVRTDSRQEMPFWFGGQAVSHFQDLEPDEIESIEIVKGPAAATLYGADASAGVIQIITKRGRPGDGRFRQSIKGEFETIDANYTPPANFAACGATDVLPTSNSTLCRGQPVGTIVSDNPLIREGILRTGHARAVTWAGRGGGERYGYYTSFAWNDEDGTLPQSAFGRKSGRINFTFAPTAGLSFDARIGLSTTENFQPQNGDNFGFLLALTGSPLTVGGPANGWLVGEWDGDALSNIESRFATRRLVPSLQVTFAPRPWFTNRLAVGAHFSDTDSRLFYPRNSQGWFFSEQASGSIQEDRIEHGVYTVDYLGNVRANLGMNGKLVTDLSAGFQIIDERTDGLTATGIGLTTNAANAISGAATRTGGQTFVHQRQVGFLGQAQFGYADRLYVQLGARIDQHSAFGNATKPFILPKVSASYVASAGRFWDAVRPVVNTFRLRAAYGTTGRAPTSGASLETYSPQPYLDNSLQVRPGVFPLSPGNQALRPEKGEELEFGFDAGLFDERLGLEFTFFRKLTKDLLLRRPLSPSLGYTEDAFANIGEVLNRGIEVVARAQVLNGRTVRLESWLSANTLHNEVVSLGGVQPFYVALGINRITEGHQIGAIFSHKIRNIDVANGRVIVSDTQEFIGNAMPTLEGHFGTSLTLRGNLRVTGQLDWKTGNLFFANTALFREKAFSVSERRVRMNDLPVEERLRVFGPYVTESGQVKGPYEVVEPYMLDSDFLRLRELAVTYTLPRRWSQMIGAGSAALTVAGRNLKLWTKAKGYDPEVIGYATDDPFLSFIRTDFLTMPPARRLSIWLNLEF